MTDKQLTKREKRETEFKKNIVLARGELKKVLPPGVSLERFERIMITAVMDNPSLLDCDPDSLMRAALKIAGWGLLPNQEEAAIFPFSGVCKAIPMRKGYLKKIHEGMDVATIIVECVRSADDFSFWNDEKGNRWKHTPALGKPRGDVIGAYAYVLDKSGAGYFEYMEKSELDKAKAASRGGAWNTWENEMQRKTVIKRLCKNLPIWDESFESMELADNEQYNVPGRKKAPRRIDPKELLGGA